MKNRESIKHWLKFKETRMALVAVCFNTELVITPLVLKGFLGMEGITLKMVAGFCATGELLFWYWFSGWAIKRIRESEPIKDAELIISSVGKEEFVEVRNTTLIHRLDKWIYEHIIGRFDFENNSPKKLFVFLKGLGYALGLPVIFVISIFPLIWIIPFTICRLTDWKIGMSVIFMANFVRSAGFSQLWDYLWTLY